VTREDYRALYRDLIVMRDKITIAIDAVAAMLASEAPPLSARLHGDAGATLEAPRLIEVVRKESGGPS
jgi:hypothetical protein